MTNAAVCSLHMQQYEALTNGSLVYHEQKHEVGGLTIKEGLCNVTPLVQPLDNLPKCAKLLRQWYPRVRTRHSA